MRLLPHQLDRPTARGVAGTLANIMLIDTPADIGRHTGVKATVSTAE
jgi:hypothetical protein